MASICKECIKNCYPDDPREACFGDYKSLCARCWRYEEVETHNLKVIDYLKIEPKMKETPLNDRILGLEKYLAGISRSLKTHLDKSKPISQDSQDIQDFKDFQDIKEIKEI